MNPILRQQYLEAMGIPLWRQRSVGDGAEEAVLAEPVPVSPETGSEAVTELQAGERPTAVAALDWEPLAARVATCTACVLHETRTNTVFGVGDRAADWMIIGEAPGADEDLQGEPFVGRAGRLLDAMLCAIGLDRSQVFIANILKCRPPGNRDPRPEEVVCCEAFLQRQIALIAPRMILVVGRVAAQNLLKSTEPVGRLRGRVHHLGDQRVPLVVTYHPAYLLRSPEQKANAWKDLQLALATLKQH